MGHDKKSIRQNVLDGDNLPNAILNAIIAGYDAPTIINDTIEVLQSGETTSYMFEATPDAIEQFAEAFMDKVGQVAADLRGFEYIDKPVIRRRSRGGTMPAQPGVQEDALAPTQETGEAETTTDGIEVESAGGEDGELAEGFDAAAPDLAEGPDSLVEQTIQKVGVNELEIDAILNTQRPVDEDGGYQGKIAIKFPVVLSASGRSSVAGALASQGVDVDELGRAVTDYALDFIRRNAEKYFGGIDPETASESLEFTGMGFSESNGNALVSTFQVGQPAADSGLARAAHRVVGGAK